MVCSGCGCEQVPGQFCRQCGARMVMGQSAFVPPAGFAPYAGYQVAPSTRVRQNLQPLGIMWIMFGVYRIVMGLIGSLVLHNLVRGGVFAEAPPFLPQLLGSLVPVIATVSILLGLGAILAGYGVLARQSWGRILTIVLGVLALIKIPFGTALGIYTLWVLAPGASGAEWDALTQRV